METSNLNYKNTPKVTLETKCWEKDWKKILLSNWLDELNRRNAFPFAKRVLFINNVKNLHSVGKAAEKAVARGSIDKFFFVEDYSEKALEYFGITKDSFCGGYYYSISELVSIYLCETEYLLHFAGDCIPYQKYRWIPSGINILESNKKVKSVCLTWNAKYEWTKFQSTSEDELFWYMPFFSDHCYLIKVDEFKKANLSEDSSVCDIYPEYGGELFEKRVGSWYWNNSFERAVYKHGAYFHFETKPRIFEQIKNRCLRYLKIFR